MTDDPSTEETPPRRSRFGMAVLSCCYIATGFALFLFMKQPLEIFEEMGIALPKMTQLLLVKLPAYVPLVLYVVLSSMLVGANLYLRSQALYLVARIVVAILAGLVLVAYALAMLLPLVAIVDAIA